MPQDELSGPDLDRVVADARAAGLPHVVIGGFAVIAHGYLRARRSFASWIGSGRHASVGFKRLAGRGQDRVDLETLERVNGELPIDPIPGLDTD